VKIASAYPSLIAAAKSAKSIDFYRPFLENKMGVFL